jgi:hypothetical protein
MARRSSRARETRRSASGTHFLNGRAEKRAGKAGSITGASSGSPRSPPVSSCVFCPSSCTPYLYPRNPPLLIQHIYNIIRTIHQERTHARTRRYSHTLSYCITQSFTPLAFPPISICALLFIPFLSLSFFPSCRFVFYPIIQCSLCLSFCRLFSLPALAFVISSFDLCSVCLTLFHLTILSRHLLAPTG